MPRTRVRRRALTPNPGGLEHAKALADAIWSRDHTMHKLAEENAKDLKSLHAEMQALELMEVEGEYGVGKRFIPRSNSTTTYDTEAAFNMLELKDFLASVKIVKGLAEQYMSGKQLQSISKTTPGAVKKEQCKVEPIKTK